MAKTLGSLTVGDKVKYGKIYGVPIVWRVADKNHEGYPGNSVTLVSDQIIKIMAADATEPSNSDSNRKSYGNNRWIHSNIRQWLNSAAAAGAWYAAQHSTDQAPDSSHVWSGYNPYSALAGFLNGFTANERAALLSTTITVGKSSTDGGGTETDTCKIFNLSCTEVGLSGDHTCGSKLALFSDNASRIAYPTEQAVSNSNYTNSNLAASKAWYWWLRDAYASDSYSVRDVFSDGTLRNYNAYRGTDGLRPAFNLSSDLLVSDSTDSDGCYTLSFNQTPACPAGISVPSSARAGESISVSWTACTDPDGDTVTYKLRRDSGFGYVEIYSGPDLEYQDTVPLNSRYVQYQVCAYDGELSSPYATSSKVSVLMDLNGVILWGGSGKELTRTLPNPATGFKATVEERGIVLSCDRPSEVSGAYLKDYWVVYKKASEGEIEHPYDGEHLIFEGLPPVSGQKLSALEIGSKVKLPLTVEGSYLKKIIIAKGHIGYPSNSITVWSEDAEFTRAFDGSNSTSTYDTAEIRAYLNTTYLNQYHENLIGNILTTAYEYSKTGTAITTLEDKVFLPSATELATGNSGMATEGVTLAYFDSSAKRVGITPYLTRSRVNTNRCCVIGTTGSISASEANTARGIRPFMNLSGDTLVSAEADAEGCYTVLV